MSALVWAAAAPSPSPSPSGAPGFDPNLVTPGWIGFLVTFLVVVATILLIWDMVRRVRRVTYRDEIRARLRAEQAEDADGDEPRGAQGQDGASEGEAPPEPGGGPR